MPIKNKVKINPQELKNLFNSIGLNRREIATACGIGIDAVNKWFFRKEIPIDHLEFIKNNIMKVKKTESSINIKDRTEKKVYFIKCNEYVKIGVATSIKDRLNQLKTGNPYSLEVIGAIYGDYAVEKFLHDKFYKYKVRDEWFKLSKEIEDFINKDELMSYQKSSILNKEGLK